MFGFTKISDNTPDELLMKFIAKGDRRSFEMLYNRYFEKLTWYAYGFVAEQQRAEDIVQDVFVKVIEKPQMFDETRKFSTWVYTVTANACRNAIRDEQNRARLMREHIMPYRSNHVDIHHRADYRILKDCISSVFAELNEKEKNIYLLRFEQELSIKEVAAIMNIPEGSVKSGIYYLLRKFAYHLKDFTNGK